MIMGNCDRMRVGNKVIEMLEKEGVTKESFSNYMKILGDKLDKYDLIPQTFGCGEDKIEEISNEIYNEIKEMVNTNG